MQARAAAGSPDVILIDEPTAQLDRATAATVNGVLEALALEPGPLISEPLAKRWDVRAGDTVATDQGQMRIAAVFAYPDDDGRDTGLANAILLPALGQPDFDECWADVWPSAAGFDSLIRPSLAVESKDASASIMTLNASRGQYFYGRR